MPANPTIALFDNDAMIKLACCDVWQDVINLYNISSAYKFADFVESRIDKLIDGAYERYLAKPPSKKFAQILTPEDLEKYKRNLRNFYDLVNVTPDELTASSTSIYNEIQRLKLPKIDDGELRLLSIILSNPNVNFMFTGDKKFIESLRDNLPDYYQSLISQNRLVSFESALTLLCQKHGFATIKPKLWRGRFCDGTLRNALGSANQNDQTEFYEHLRQYDPLNNYQAEKLPA